jgi:hypothetical protein
VVPTCSYSSSEQQLPYGKRATAFDDNMENDLEEAEHVEKTAELLHSQTMESSIKELPSADGRSCKEGQTAALQAQAEHTATIEKTKDDEQHTPSDLELEEALDLELEDEISDRELEEEALDLQEASDLELEEEALDLQEASDLELEEEEEMPDLEFEEEASDLEEEVELEEAACLLTRHALIPFPSIAGELEMMDTPILEVSEGDDAP